MSARKRILVVEDQELNRDLLVQILEDAYAVLVSVDGADAVAQAERERPDLILMDFGMPVMDGWEATRRIKAHPQLRTFFLSILDRGTTTDNRGRVLDFANTMVFFTSNLGYSDVQQAASPIGYRDDATRREAQDADVRRQLRRTLSPEFANRLRLVHFTRLTRGSAERILRLELERILTRYREVHGIEVRLTGAAEAELLRLGFSPENGARHLAAVLETICNVEVARRIHRDDRGPARDREGLLRWLRELRAGGRAFDPAELKARVLAEARARTGYAALRVDHDASGFTYTPERP